MRGFGGTKNKQTKSKMNKLQALQNAADMCGLLIYEKPENDKRKTVTRYFAQRGQETVSPVLEYMEMNYFLLGWINCTKKTTEMDIVVFRKFKDGDVIALFPEMKHGQFINSYMHIGQHGDATPDLITARDVPLLVPAPDFVTNIVGVPISMGIAGGAFYQYNYQAQYLFYLGAVGGERITATQRLACLPSRSTLDLRVSSSGKTRPLVIVWKMCSKTTPGFFVSGMPRK
jgi:hypothetical protein